MCSSDLAWRLANEVEKQENLTSLISRADFVPLHLPVLENTKNLIDRKVMLTLWVKIKAGWSDDERALRSLGYDHR